MLSDIEIAQKNSMPQFRVLNKIYKKGVIH